MAGPTPTKVTIRSYLVGFGDCFLLSFHYGEGVTPSIRRVLIDFGSTRYARSKLTLEEVADRIRAHIEQDGGGLDAVVATHRHADHIKGFGGKAGEIIASLQPKVVVQPWTEDPDAATDARAPTYGTRQSVAAFVRALDEMHEVGEYAARELDRLSAHREVRGFTQSVKQQLGYLGEVNIKNKPAVDNLIRMGRNGRAVYAHFGADAGLRRILPGVKVHVLGPPTLEQSEAIATQRASHPDEFWHVQALSARRVGNGEPARLFPTAGVASPDRLPFETQWFLPRLSQLRGEQLLEIVRALDSALNNTSLILLFEVGPRTLLFPGDAQIENWRYCLNEAPARPRNRYRKLLAETDAYKVGHHGSLNATPKSLWELFKKKGDDTSPHRMHSLLSTLPGVHGHASSGTEVPRTTLVEALKSHTVFSSTQTLSRTNHFTEVALV